MTRDHAHEAEADRLLVVNDHGTGFQDGEHHHHYPGVPDPRVTVQASIKATTAGAVLGRPIDQWDPADLGVHDSITVENETTLTPYLPRDHDTDLRGHLKDLMAAGAGSRLVLVVGPLLHRQDPRPVRGRARDPAGLAAGAAGAPTATSPASCSAGSPRAPWCGSTSCRTNSPAAQPPAPPAPPDPPAPGKRRGRANPVHRNHLANQPRRAERTTHPQGVIRRGRRHQQTTQRNQPALVEVPETFTDADLTTAQN